MILDLGSRIRNPGTWIPDDYDYSANCLRPPFPPFKRGAYQIDNLRSKTLDPRSTMPDPRSWIQDPGSRVLDPASSMLDIDQDPRPWTLDP